jgi:hypothetical protein
MEASNRIAFAVATTLCACAVAGAQGVRVPEEFAKGPHTGPVETAIVGVTTRFTDGHSVVLEERHGCGMALRCDGFVLFSAAMLDHRADEPEDIRPTIELTFRPGTPDEQKVKAPWPKSIPSGVSLRMVKVEGVHVPALRTLLPDVLKRGDTLTAVWQPWIEAARRFGAIVRQPVHFAAIGKPPAVWSAACEEPLDDAPPGAIVVGPEGMAVGMVTARAGESRRGFVSMEALARVTNCVAPVPTPDADFAARAKGDAVDAPPLAGDAQTEAAALPDAAKPGDDGVAGGAGAASLGGMVKVAGGPVILPKAILQTQIEMEKATVACVPPFQIDKYEVTNQQYWDFWSALPAKTSAEQAFKRQAWPAGWANAPVPFAPDLARLPVLGVALPGAEAYACAQGKRLPTPYEWALAALGADGDTKAPEWLAQYVADKNETALHIKKAHLAFLQSAPEIHGDDFLLLSTRLHNLTLTKVKVGRSWLTVNADQRIHGSDFMVGLPWIISPLLGFAPELQAGGGFFDALDGVTGLDLPLRLKMQKWSKELVEAQTQSLWNKWKAPSYVLPVGSRSFDIGPCGAADMILNGAELVRAPATAPSGLLGFAVSVTMLHPQDKRILDEMLLVSGPNPSGLVEEYASPAAYPLSRLIERSPGFPVAQWLWFQNNVEEARAAMRLVNGWQVNMQPAVSTVELRIDNHSPFVGPVFYDNYPLYKEWARPSKHTRAEIGSAIPLPAQEPLPTPLVPRDTGAFVRFLIPIGFRCAR